jgi:hypothetical protein
LSGQENAAVETERPETITGLKIPVAVKQISGPDKKNSSDLEKDIKIPVKKVDKTIKKAPIQPSKIVSKLKSKI